jgi:uncharacterized membrane protein SirB2
MSRDWRIIFRFALLSLAIAAVFFGISEADPSPGSSVAIWAGVATMILCPGSLLFVTAFDIEPQTTGSAAMWLIIGLINSAVYAVIGAAYVGLRKKRDGSATS